MKTDINQQNKFRLPNLMMTVIVDKAHMLADANQEKKKGELPIADKEKVVETYRNEES